MKKLRAILRRIIGFIRRAITVMSRRVSQLIDLRDVVVFSGLGAMGYGIAQVHVPAAWVVVGGIVFLLGIRR